MDDGTIMTGEQLVARDKARKKLTPEQALLLSNDPRSGVGYDQKPGPRKSSCKIAPASTALDSPGATTAGGAKLFR